MTYCHAFEPLPKAGVMLCTLLDGHRGNHLDVPHNRAFKVRPVHLHGPVSGPVCGADVPADRKRGMTAYSTDVTCGACLGTLSEKAQADRAWLRRALDNDN